MSRLYKQTRLNLNVKIMERVKNSYSIRIASFMLLLLLGSCSKDEDNQVAEGEESIAIDNTTNVAAQNSNDPDDDDYGMITLYSVANGSITKKRDFNTSGELKVAQDDVLFHQEIWKRVAQMIPEDRLAKMDEFMIYWGGFVGSAGFASHINPELSKWILGIAVDYTVLNEPEGEQNLNYLIAHEYGHILSLNDTQVDGSIDEDNCQAFYTGSGCSNTDSFMNQFYNYHWADIWPEREKIQDADGNDDDFFTTYESRFVTRYAGTNPTEDIAEVFAYFVLEDDLPINGTSKVEAMYANDELSALRQQMRQNIGLNTAKKTSSSLASSKLRNSLENKDVLGCGLNKKRY